MKTIKLYRIVLFLLPLFGIYSCSKDSIKPLTAASATVYIAGVASGASGDVAVLWKNGVATTLTEVSPSVARSVFVSGSDVYVAGQIGNNATLWKNGVPTALPGGWSAWSVFVSGSDVYVAGESFTNAMLWKNGVVTLLPGGVQASSVFVSGSDVYVVGWGPNVGLWKNGAVVSSVSGTSVLFQVPMFM